MAKVTLALLKDHPDVREISDQIKALGAGCEAEIKPLEKQIEKKIEDLKVARLKLFEKIEGLLSARGLLPSDYDGQKDNLTVDRDLDVIFVEKNDGCGPNKTARAIGEAIVKAAQETFF